MTRDIGREARNPKNKYTCLRDAGPKKTERYWPSGPNSRQTAKKREPQTPPAPWHS